MRMSKDEMRNEILTMKKYNYTLTDTEVFDWMIQQLDKKSCDDAISRQYAIDNLDKTIYFKTHKNIASIVKNYLTNLPPVEPIVKKANSTTSKTKAKIPQKTTKSETKKKTNTADMKWKYTVCNETTDVLGSGSTYNMVAVTYDEKEAFELLKKGRNHLERIGKLNGNIVSQYYHHGQWID